VPRIIISLSFHRRWSSFSVIAVPSMIAAPICGQPPPALGGRVRDPFRRQRDRLAVGPNLRVIA
jgi:hypothetical protein